MRPRSGPRRGARASGHRNFFAGSNRPGIGRDARSCLHRCANARSVLCGARNAGRPLAGSDRAAVRIAAGAGPAAGRRLDRLRQRIPRVWKSRLEARVAGSASDRDGGGAARGPAPAGGGRRRRGAGDAGLRARQGRLYEAGAGKPMSAVLKDVPELAPMREADLAHVLAIESAIYTHPWTLGNFADSLRAGYDCFTWRVNGELVGYFILMAAAGEAHLLNLSIASNHQRRGHGSALLHEAAALARRGGAKNMFLEVRPSNRAAQDLYSRFGFRKIAVRRDYYPAHFGREDALVFSLVL